MFCIVGWTVAGGFPVQAEKEEGSYWSRYLPDWLQNISHDGFPDLQKEIQEIEQAFEGVKPVPGEETGVLIKKPLEAPSVRFYGPAEFKNCSVKGDVHAHGPLFLKKVDCRGLYAEGAVDAREISLEEGLFEGPTKLENTKVEGILTVRGPLLVKTSSVKGKIIIKNEKAIFSASQIEGDIVIEPLPNHAPQQVYLLGGTEVQGNVIFQENNPGNKIFVDKKSHVHGNVKGAGQP